MAAGILTRLPLLAKWSGRMIQIKTPQELELMRAAGLVVAGAIAEVRKAVRPGVSTGELDAIAEDYIRSKGAIPSFLGYHGFTGSICASINHEIVHGIPSPERVLKEGDIVSLDVGVGYRGYFTDSAVTVGVGTVDAKTAKLLQVTKASLDAGIAAAQLGNHIG